MLVQNNIFICTIKELVELLTNFITAKDSPRDINFEPINFSLLSEGYDGKTEPEVIASGAEGWYGIRSIDTGFNDEDLTLCANYYGGGSPHLAYIYEGCSEKEIKTMLSVIIQGTLTLELSNIDGLIDDKMMLVVETQQELYKYV